MTVLVDRPETVSKRRVLGQLATFEARRLWRHPALIAAVAITANELYRQTDLSRAPVLNRLSFTTAWPMLFMAAGVFLALGSAASRRHAIDNIEGLDALPAPASTNALGISLAFLTPLAAGIALQAAFLVPRLLDSPATSIVWSELMTGPATVALGATAGLAFGWGFRWRWVLPIIALVLVGAVGTVWWAQSGYLLGPYTPWLAPVPGLDWNQYAFEQAYRPSLPHLAYVLALAALFAAVSTIRGRRRRGQVLGAAASALLLGLTWWAATEQLRELTAGEEQQRQAPYQPSAGDYSCDGRGAVTYCAYRGYEPWIEDWAALVDRVLALVPADAGAPPLEIRQQVPYFNDDEEIPLQGDIGTGMWWSRRAFDDGTIAYPLGLALATAGWAVGLPTRHTPVTVTVVDGESVAAPVNEPSTVSPDDLQYQSCSSHGQARAVAALWYATQASLESVEGLRYLASGERYGDVSPTENFIIDLGYRQPSSAVAYLRREAQIALAMSELPQSQVAGTLSRRWSEVIDPTTTTEAIATWFGVSVPGMGSPDESRVPCA